MTLYLLPFLMLHCLIAQADNMSNAYERAKSNSSSYNNDALKYIQTTPIESIPGYETTNVREISYADDLTTPDKSKEFALSDPTVKAQYDSAKTMLSNRPPMDKQAWQHAENIAKDSDKYANADGYCKEGDCVELVDTPNEDIFKSTAALEEVLGGGASSVQAGTNEVLIYSGKKELCKKDNWGFADCCKDEGWGVEIGLKSCPQETQDLGEQKRLGLCHYVGDYEVVIRKLGVEVRTDKYKSYCCYPSKMAKLTQEGARNPRDPQLGLSWGRAKYPSCYGLTSKQFSAIDFSKIDLKPIMDDIEKNVVEPATDEMLKKPNQYISEQGIMSW